MRDEHPSAVGELARAWQTWPGPSIIMAGDSNTTRDAVMSAMTRLHCPRIQAPLMALMTPFDFSVKLEKIEPVQADREMLALLAIADRGAGQPYERLPHIRGVDNKHEVGCYDICVATPPAPPDSHCPKASSGSCPGHDMQSAREARATTQGQKSRRRLTHKRRRAQKGMRRRTRGRRTAGVVRQKGDSCAVAHRASPWVSSWRPI